MIPYTSFLYFGVLLYVTLPTFLVQGVSRRYLTQAWLLLVITVMLVLQYWIPLLWVVLAYALIQWLAAQTFLYLRKRGKSRVEFYIVIGLALLPLMVVKVDPLFHKVTLLEFLGISYLTFRVIDVVVNIQDGLIKRLPLPDYAAYLLFFPTISSGPIDRYRRFVQDWHHQRTRTEFMSDLDGGINRIFRGFLYKFILAVVIKRVWLDPAAQVSTASGVISYMYAYSLYLFFDFAGYSTFAIGISYFFGIHTPENFNRPFFSRTIREFWDRWHISLSWWFRDYVYSRFVYAVVKSKRLTDKATISYLGYFVSMGLMGLWHGLTWYYVVYGLYHGTLLVVYDLFSRFIKRRGGITPRWQRAGDLASMLITFNLVCFGLLIFSGRLDSKFMP